MYGVLIENDGVYESALIDADGNPCCFPHFHQATLAALRYESNSFTPPRFTARVFSWDEEGEAICQLARDKRDGKLRRVGAEV